MYGDFLQPSYFLFSGNYVLPLVLFLCVYFCCFCMVIFHTFFSNLCVSVLGFFYVWLALRLRKRKFHMYNSPFSLNASDFHLPLKIYTFTFSPFYVFVVTSYPYLCHKFVGDLIHSVVTFCSFFQIEQLPRVFSVVDVLC